MAFRVRPGCCSSPTGCPTCSPGTTPSSITLTFANVANSSSMSCTCGPSFNGSWVLLPLTGPFLCQYQLNGVVTCDGVDVNLNTTFGTPGTVGPNWILEITDSGGDAGCVFYVDFGTPTSPFNCLFGSNISATNLNPSDDGCVDWTNATCSVTFNP
jgi:hypothetical protein